MKEKVVWITGASSGIGAQLAIQFAKQGAIPILIARSQEKLAQISRQIPSKHDSFVVDIQDQTQIEAALKQTLAKWGKIDILVNNAGVGYFQYFKETSFEQMHHMISLNLTSLMTCTSLILPHMIRCGQGHIVNIGSLAGKVATPKTAVYAATKHGVIGFSHSLRQEMKPYGIHVTCVNPGPIATPFFDIADPSNEYLRNMKSWVLVPEKVATCIIQAVKKKKIELNLPVSLGFLSKVVQLFPKTAYQIAAIWLDRK